MKSITSNENKIAVKYENTVPDQFGNLHERMQYLMCCAKKYGTTGMPSEIWHAIWDLQTEVKYYEPVNPPYGQRVSPK